MKRHSEILCSRDILHKNDTEVNKYITKSETPNRDTTADYSIQSLFEAPFQTQYEKGLEDEESKETSECTKNRSQKFELVKDCDLFLKEKFHKELCQCSKCRWKTHRLSVYFKDDESCSEEQDDGDQNQEVDQDMDEDKQKLKALLN